MDTLLIILGLYVLYKLNIFNLAWDLIFKSGDPKEPQPSNQHSYQVGRSLYHFLKAPSVKRDVQKEAFFHWPSEGNFDFEIVGESNYQPAIAALVEGTTPGETFTALLIPENENPYDKLAVRVEIDGRTVGYLSREDARSFRRRLSAKKLSGKATQCMASLIGGQTRLSGETLSYGVTLDIKPFNN
jgi:hypothetical protein